MNTATSHLTELVTREDAAQPGLGASRERASAVVGVVAVALAAVALLLAGSDAEPALIVLGALSAVWAIAGITVGIRQRCPVAVIVSAIALDIAAGALAWSALQHRSPTGGGETVALLTERLALTLGAAFVTHLLVALPDGVIERRSHVRVVIGYYGAAVALALILMTDRSNVLVWPVVFAWLSAAAVLPLANRRYRAAGAIDRRRLQWIGWACAVATEIVLVSAALTLLVDWPHHTGEIALAATGLVPLAILAGTVPRFVARVDRLLTYTVSLTGLTALIVAAYVVALATFGRKPDGSERTLLLLSMLAAAGAALAYQPARLWLADRANRVVYGERVSPDEALRTWGTRLTRAIPLDELLLQLAEALRKSLQLSSAQVWTGSAGRYELAAGVPHRALAPMLVGDKELPIVTRAGVSGGTWLDVWLPAAVGTNGSAATRVAPIAHAGELLGLLVCERRADGEPFTDEDDRVLTELARQVALALHNVQLDTALQASLDELRQTNEELRASRARIVSAGDAERRKLERNLHDGAQQHLVALAVKLRLAKDAVLDDPTYAEAMIEEVRGDMQGAIAELRSLAHGIFPPLLMSGGLAEALPAAAGRAGIPASTIIRGVGRHPAEIEATVYFCCSEALQNAGKHAGEGSSAVVEVWEDDAGLHWEVRDDGAGFDPSGVADLGHGFINMRDRMGSVGGTLEVESVVGQGTRIIGHLPLT